VFQNTPDPDSFKPRQSGQLKNYPLCLGFKLPETLIPKVAVFQNTPIIKRGELVVGRKTENGKK
jgi:hypothetical protein